MSDTKTHADIVDSQTTASLDETLREIGLAPVRAWMPDASQKTATAKRARRARDKSAEQGLKQLSITLPEHLHPLARELAARTKAGEPVIDVLDALKHAHATPTGRKGGAVPAKTRARCRWLAPLKLLRYFERLFQQLRAR